MDFPDIDSFLRYWATRTVQVEHEIHHRVAWAASDIKADAKARIGTYQQAEGPFPAWAPLSENTLNGFDFGNGKHIPGKIEQGYAPPDNPVLREGTLRESIQSTVLPNEMAVGSNEQNAVWQEQGTVTQPPRSFLGAAAHHHADRIAQGIGEAVYDILAGQTPPPRRIP